VGSGCATAATVATVPAPLPNERLVLAFSPYVHNMSRRRPLHKDVPASPRSASHGRRRRAYAVTRRAVGAGPSPAVATATEAPRRHQPILYGPPPPSDRHHHVVRAAARRAITAPPLPAVNADASPTTLPANLSAIPTPTHCQRCHQASRPCRHARSCRCHPPPPPSPPPTRTFAPHPRLRRHVPPRGRRGHRSQVGTRQYSGSLLDPRPPRPPLRPLLHPPNRRRLLPRHCLRHHVAAATRITGWFLPPPQPLLTSPTRPRCRRQRRCRPALSRCRRWHGAQAATR